MIDQARVLSTTDARVWAEEFCSMFSVFTDEGVVEDKLGLMIGWFANAIETGRAQAFPYPTDRDDDEEPAVPRNRQRPVATLVTEHPYRITVGIPGSGKSTQARYWAVQGFEVISSDDLRLELTGSMEDFSKEDEVWKTAQSRAKRCLRSGTPFVVDATSLIPKYRLPWVQLGRDYGVQPVAYRFEVPYGEACQRNWNRDRIVPTHVMERMLTAWIAHCSVEQLESEGFEVVDVAQVKL